MRRRTFTASWAAALLLAGCGWRLRGALQYPFRTLAFAGTSASPTQQLLARLLAGQQVRILPAEQAAQADVVFEVIEDAQEQLASVMASVGAVREVQLRQRFVFGLRTGSGQLLLDAVTIHLTRTLNYNESEALSREAEFALLWRDMRNDAAQQTLRRLSALALPPAAAQH